MLRFARWVWSLIRNVADNDLHNHAAEMAYFALMSVFPFFLLLISAVAFLDIPDLFDQTMGLIETVTPAAVVQLIETTVYNVTHVQQINLLSITAVVAVWWSLGAMSSTTRGLNKVFGMLDPRHVAHFFGLTILLTLLLGTLLVVAIVLIMLGPVIHNAITARIDVGWFGDAMLAAFRYGVAGFFLLLGHAGIYWICPAVERKFRLITPGSILSAVGWVVVSFGLQTYLRHFNNYNKIYGSLGAVILTLFWFYLMSFVLLLGGQIDAMLHPEYKARQQNGGKPPEYRLSRFPVKLAVSTIIGVAILGMGVHFVFKHDIFTPAPHELRGPIGAAIQKALKDGTEKVSHEDYARVLARFVDESGDVDYAGLRADPKELDEYINRIGSLDLAKIEKTHLHALVINLWNATALRIIAQNYDTFDSAKDLTNYLTRRTVKLMGERISLDNLEHAILRSYFSDPCNPFALARGTKSKPRLQRVPYDGDHLLEQLEAAARDCLGSVTISKSGDYVQVPRVIHDYAKDLEVQGVANKLSPFLMKYFPPEAKALLEKLGDRALSYRFMDWTLNAKPQ